jgi:hypothetical protein
MHLSGFNNIQTNTSLSPHKVFFFFFFLFSFLFFPFFFFLTMRTSSNRNFPFTPSASPGHWDSSGLDSLGRPERTRGVATSHLTSRSGQLLVLQALPKGAPRVLTERDSARGEPRPQRPGQ